MSSPVLELDARVATARVNVAVKLALFASFAVALVFFVALLWKLAPVAFRYWWVSEVRA